MQNICLHLPTYCYHSVVCEFLNSLAICLLLYSQALHYILLLKCGGSYNAMIWLCFCFDFVATVVQIVQSHYWILWISVYCVLSSTLQSWILNQDLECTMDPVTIVMTLLQLQFVYSYVLYRNLYNGQYFDY